MKIIHHERKRLASHFSIERLFADIRRRMPSGIEVTSCPAPNASVGILPRLRNVLHAARQQADVHHIVGDSHYLAFGLPPQKTVLTIHDCAALGRLRGCRRAALKYFWFIGPMRRAAAVTTISQATKNELRKWVGPLADKVVVVPDCVGEEFTYDPKPFNEDAPVILQVGTKWNKNVERVMEAVRGMGCRLEIVGNLTEKQKAGYGNLSHGLKRIEEDIFYAGDTGAKPLLPRSAADLKPTNLTLKTTAGVEPAVHELGRLSDAELAEAYRRCDIVVFASLYEGFGLPILEAQATGRPVITSDFGAMPEAADDGALLVDPYSVEAIRDAVLRIKNEPTLRAELVSKGLKNVERFRPAAIAERYGEIYRRLATD